MVGVVFFFSSGRGRSASRTDTVRVLARRRARSPIVAGAIRWGKSAVLVVVALVEVGKDASGLGFCGESAFCLGGSLFVGRSASSAVGDVGSGEPVGRRAQAAVVLGLVVGV